MHFLEKCTAEKEAFNYRQKVELTRLLRKQEEETLFLQGTRYLTYTFRVKKVGLIQPNCSGSRRKNLYSYRAPGTSPIHLGLRRLG
jgi:hypothetical protein